MSVPEGRRAFTNGGLVRDPHKKLTVKPISPYPMDPYMVQRNTPPPSRIGPDPAVGIHLIYTLLREHFGHRHWWPGDTRDEIIIGAVLTQNTAWTNVERAIENLRNAEYITLETVASCPLSRLEELIRPSGYYRQKASRLISVARNLIEYPGGADGFLDPARGWEAIRGDLLAMKGIGPETADSILLYAASILSFVVDSYTHRIFLRLGLWKEGYDYNGLQSLITANIPEDVKLYGDYHAQLVELGKTHCAKRRPSCTECPLAEMCPGFGKDTV